MTQWYAVRCAARRERSVMMGLMEREFIVFLPMMTRWGNDPRRPKEKLWTPLLPGYLFVLCHSANFRAVLETEGVIGFVEATTEGGVDRPVAFPLSEVTRFQAEERSGCYDYTRARRVRYQPKKGDRVKVVAGPYLTFFAKVLATPKGEKVHVMMEGPKERGHTLMIDHVEQAA